MNPRRMGVIAIGSNSVRMLTANLDESLSSPVRGREETALFLSMDDKRNFSEEAMERTARAVSLLARKAQDAGAEELRLIATCAMRDAANRNDLDFYVAATAPLMLNRIISGEEEAMLSYLAATSIPPTQGLQGMVDIGGGSTEIAVGQEGQIETARSLQLGASRLFNWQPIHTEADVLTASRLSAEVIFSALPADLPQSEHWTLVGGTGTTLVCLIQGLPYPMQPSEDTVVHAQEVEWWLYHLARLTPHERAQIPGMPASRVHIMPTGLCILHTLMQRLSIDQVRVTRRTNLDGYLYRLYRWPKEDADAQVD